MIHVAVEITTGDPVGYFLEEQSLHGRSDRTVEAYERVLREFETFLDEEREVDTPARAGRRDCLSWVHTLRGELAESTIATYASYVHRFYAYMVDVDQFDANPMSVVVEEMHESIDVDPTRRELDVSDMRRLVGHAGHPLDRAVIVTLLKTGMRVGELVNLDLQDVAMEPSGIECTWERRVELSTRPRTLFVDPAAVRGRTLNGERRTASNKRQRETLVPIDAELQRVLTRWLAIRPDAVSPARPLFLNTRGRWGSRLSTDDVRRIVREHAEAFGWYRVGGGPRENVTPHYFRHFFTTHLRDRTGERGVVKYLRGDVADDVLDTYTHHWGERVREVYERHIYDLGT